MNLRTPSVQKTAAGCAAVLASLTIAAMPGTATASAPGNNGTVKVAPDGDIDAIPNNHPHVGCTFQLEWYGFDENAVSAVTFEQQAPTTDGTMTVSGPSSVQLDGDPGNGAGNGGFDGSADYTLAFTGAPHPQQGYHVKLTINTNESKGADVKHKVFWVEGCDAPTPPTTPTTPPTTEPPTTPPVTPPVTPPTTEPTTPSTTPPTTPSTTTTPPTTTPTTPATPEDTITSSTTASATPTPSATPSAEDSTEDSTDEPQAEVLGEQASANTKPNQGSETANNKAQAVPSSINAGLESESGTDNGLVLAWLAGLGALLGGLALLARRRRV